MATLAEGNLWIGKARQGTGGVATLPFSCFSKAEKLKMEILQLWQGRAGVPATLGSLWRL